VSGPHVSLAEFEAAARDLLDRPVWDYIAGGAGDERTLRANLTAFDRYTLRPRMLSGVTQPQPAVEILGARWAAPIAVAPTAYHTMVHPDGEVATAAGAAEAGLPMVVSTFAGRALADIAAATTTPLWQQIYCFKDREQTRDLAVRAAQTGFRAIVLTVDTPQTGRRLRDLRNDFRLPEGIHAANLGAAHRTARPRDHARDNFDRAIGWETVGWLGSLTGLPVVVKGVLTAGDAVAAVDAGAAAVIVSNHGGRQLDGVPASLRALPEVVQAVADRCPVLVDGGIRRGTDVLIALALGAAAVLIGRPVLHGLAVDGADGVAALLRLLVEETVDAMQQSGRADVADCRHDLIGPGNADIDERQCVS
jgi:(S)-3,5-dihydroxyphenylglycine transaminase